jgi:hexosaminidase
MSVNLLRTSSCVICLAIGFLLYSCKQPSTKPELEVVWKLERNFHAQGHDVHTAAFWLINRGTQTLGDQDWALYWNQPPYYVALVESEKPLSVNRINGDFYQLKPQAGFSLKPGDSVKVAYTEDGWMIKNTDSPQGLYLAYQLEGKEHTELIRYFKVLPFEKPEQLSRSARDEQPIPTAEFLFSQNENLVPLSESERYPFIPAPKKFTRQPGSLGLGTELVVSYPGELENEGRYLQSELRNQFGISARSGKNLSTIQLETSTSVTNREGYVLTVNQQGVRIAGASPAGVFYGIQSLLNLITQEETRWVVPHGVVEDEPAFSYRGLHLDVGRNFQSKETVLRLIDLMAKYKLNKFLFYLTEDEGWRIEIESFPELTEVGARRGHAHRDSLYLQPAYGSGPDADNPQSYGNGFYSREDFKEIIRYAYDRHIDVIPEINLPGHARAAIRAMELRYQRLMKDGKEAEAKKFRLIDPADTSRYNSAQGYNDNVVCVCQEAVYDFFEVALDDLIQLYKEADVPMTMMHTGGDEVPAEAWSASPLCQEFLKARPEIRNARNLQSYFFDRITEIIRTKNLPAGAWEEAVMSYDDKNQWYPNKQFVDKEVYPYIWNNLWGNQDLGYRVANAGYPVILCNVTSFYFDLAYNKDPREPGLYWAGFVDTRDAFSFIPYNLFLSTGTDNLGRKFNPEIDFAGMERLTPAGKKNIVGLQAQIWSETIKGRDMLEYYSLPKLLGFAQRAWQGQPEWGDGRNEEQRLKTYEQDWNRFVNTVGLKELPRVESYNGGYHYRIPAPGISKDKDGKVMMNCRYPGFEIRYTTDGSEPDQNSARYERPISLSASTIKAAAFNRKGRSGFVTTFTLN